MGDTSGQWWDKMWSPATGCTAVSAGCANCWAKMMAGRFWAKQYPDVLRITGKDVSRLPVTVAECCEADGLTRPRAFSDVRCHPKRLDHPLHWRKPRKVFVCSMGDLFHEDVPTQFVDGVFAVMSLLPQHTFQVLTKRPERMRAYLSENTVLFEIDSVAASTLAKHTDQNHVTLPRSGAWPLPNVWLGVSIEDQATADERIPLLLETPAAVRFISYEPALAPVRLRTGIYQQESGFRGTSLDGIDWVICGGESGPGARPMHPDWARSVRDQCQEAGVPFFFKQWGEWQPAADIDVTDPIMGISTDSPRYHALPNGGGMARVGKKAAGRLLDGRTWDECPEVAA